MVVQLKWPNDIYINDHKVGGILIENQWNGGSLSDSIVGFGINVLQTSFPDEAGNASSLNLNAPHVSLDLETLRKALNERIAQNYAALKAGERELIDRLYHKRLWRRDHVQRFQEGEQEFEGKVESVDLQGQLVVRTSDQLRLFAVGEIQFLA